MSSLTNDMFIVTRTMPVGNGGKFTPEARAIYELVLEMQRASADFGFSPDLLTEHLSHSFPSRYSSRVCTGMRCNYFVIVLS